MKHKITSVFISAALIFTLSSAASAVDGTVEEHFPAKHGYTAFSDVPAGSWFADSVKLCCETGLMNGSDQKSNTFSPSRNITIAELSVISARVREAVTGEPIVLASPAPGTTVPWYQSYTDYLARAGVSVGDPALSATRGDFIRILGAILPDEYLTPINTISTLPDSGDAGVLRLYNAGILTGVDAYGTFSGARSLTRSEVAAMLSRVIRPTLRQSFTPKVWEEDVIRNLTGKDTDTPAFQKGTVKVTMGEYLHYVVTYADLLNDECQRQGIPFHMNNTVDDTDFRSYITSHANTQALELRWLEQQYPTLTGEQTVEVETAFQDALTNRGGQAGLQKWLNGQALTLSSFRTLLENDCRLSAIKQSIVVDPAEFAAWVEKNQIYSAKHILVGDESLAKNLSESLRRDSSEENFDKLMEQYTTDTVGLQTYPDGYTFTTGEMVPVFETTVQSLAVGGISQPVQSEFGWHIILRLQPDDEDYRQMMLDQQFQTWLDALPAGEGTAHYNSLDEAEFYQSILALR